MFFGSMRLHRWNSEVSTCVGEQRSQRRFPMLSTILVVVLILLLIGALPTWGYSGSWGYGPGGIVGVLLIVVIVLALTGRI